MNTHEECLIDSVLFGDEEESAESLRMLQEIDPRYHICPKHDTLVLMPDGCECEEE